MLTDQVLADLIPEIFARLCMMDDDIEYEIAVRGREDLLGISGSANNAKFELTPVSIKPGGVRCDMPKKLFTLRREGTHELAGATHPKISIVSVDEPSVELREWLRSDPWNPEQCD